MTDFDSSSSLSDLLSRLQLDRSSNSAHSDGDWQERFLRDFGQDAAISRPTPMLWRQFYLNSIKFDHQRGQMFAEKLKKLNYKVLEETLSTLQDYVLSGDTDITAYYIDRTRSRSKEEATSTVVINANETQAEEMETDEEESEEKKEERKKNMFSVANHNSLLQFAALNGIPMVQAILREVLEEIDSSALVNYVNRGDVITGFTALHLAFFVENVQLISFLIDLGADIDKADNYFGTPLDYARMMGLIPNHDLKNPITKLQYFDPSSKEVKNMSIKDFESVTGTTFTPFLKCGGEYIEELMFCGISIDNPDMKFRETYGKIMYSSSGDENLVLHRIDDDVGYGVFAAKDFKEGDYIVRYGGYLNSIDRVKTKSYLMASGLEGVGLDSYRNRNFGGMINHSPQPNAESTCVFDRGAEQAIIIAKTDIPKGTQILINYSKNYWTKSEAKQLKELKAVDRLEFK